MDLDLEDDEEGAVTPPTGADIAPSLTGPVKAAAAWSSISLARRSAAAICSRESPERSRFFGSRRRAGAWEGVMTGVIAVAVWVVVALVEVDAAWVAVDFLRMVVVVVVVVVDDAA